MDHGDSMTTLGGSYTLFVDQHGVLRLQMHGAPRSVFVGGLVEVEHSGDIMFVSNPQRHRHLRDRSSDDAPEA